MATFAEIQKKESDRSELSDFQKIYLFSEGKFCHAYEVSAWLYSRTASDSLKVRRQKSKGFPDGSYVMVGHPSEEKSFSKYAPKDSSMVQEGETYTITLPDSFLPKEVTRDILLADYEKWKSEQLFSETKNDIKDDTPKNPARPSSKHTPMDVDDVLQQIIAYPLENRTLLDTVTFVSDLKRQVSILITAADTH